MANIPFTLIVTTYCIMSFNRFPFDSQTCKFLMGSSNYPIGELVFNSSIVMEKNESGLMSFTYTVSDISEEDKTQESSGQKWSKCGFVIHLERSSGSYILRYFLPSAVIVIVSWVGFIIDPNAVPARVGLQATLLLVLISLFGTVQVRISTAPCSPVS